jgi:hypothetical protein
MFGLDREASQHLLLFLMVWSLFAGLGVVLGKKKGVSPAFAILGSFPLWVAFFAFWLVRQPDINED